MVQIKRIELQHYYPKDLKPVPEKYCDHKYLSILCPEKDTYLCNEWNIANKMSSTKLLNKCYL
jgi:hypothetical protein